MNALSKHIIILPLIYLLLNVEGYGQSVLRDQEAEGDSSTLVYTVYLLGDIKNSPAGNQNLQLLRRYLKGESSNSAVVFLGDLVYPLGMPDSLDAGFDEANDDLEVIFRSLEGYEGQVFFLPGNHDWSRGRRQGWESVKNEEKLIERFFERGNVYLPDNGCPGPVEVSLTNDITLIIFDSQWWFHENEKPGKEDGCSFTDESELFIKIEDALRRNQDRKVIIATHHPLYSAGQHGGHFPASFLLFPLLDFNSRMYIPLPGFIYVGYRKFLGHNQDLAHPNYKEFRKTLISVLRNYPNVIYAAGHEHNLQYLQRDSLHHIISGGGGEPTYLSKKSTKADFACQCSGFGKLSFYKNGDVRMTFISADQNENGNTVFSRELFNKPVFDPDKKKELLNKVNFADSSVRVVINDMYDNIRKMRRFMMGENYRKVWSEPVELPVFSMGMEQGGLSVIKRGGGMQTRSLRLEDKDGRQYVLRSVNKYINNALPEYFRNTIATKPVQDAISASHPFGAITLPPLEDAVGIMHTNPKIVWLPDDPNLGIYRKEFAGDVYLFEERPAGNRRDLASFGHSEKITSTAKTIKKTLDDHDHVIDQKAVLKARLFDMLVNDWDRHDDQWRWATFKKGKETIYRPIPRDRDQVYFVNEGPLMWLASRKWLMPKFQGFDYDIKNVEGLNFNARYFDRSFITEPSLDDWIAAANDVRQGITDSVIHEAITRMPENIYDLSGPEIEDKLKSRKALLPGYAQQYYRFLARKVDVTGTDERELFEIKRRENGDTEVTVFALSHKKGKVKKRLYHREFKYGETKEIRIYGLGEKDSVRITGHGKKGIKVRVIGGKGDDTIIDDSRVNGLSKKTVIYDRKDKDNKIKKGPETRLQLSHEKSVNIYDRKQFRYNKTMPVFWFGYNIDDGVLIGGGVRINRYNFRDSTIQKIQGNLAVKTGAFALRYEGLFTAVSRKFDLYVDADLSFPRNVDYYYGLGNETKKVTDEKKYYRVRYKYANINPMLKQTLNRKFYYGFGAFYQYFMVTDTTGRFIGDIYPDLLDSVAYLPHHYAGINLKFNMDTRDDKILPHSGAVWDTEIGGYYNFREPGKHFVKVRSELSFFLSFRKDPRVVFAFRFGGAMNLGDYEFYYANFLSGKTNLRGFRNNRYAGDHSFYQNTEIRYKITNISSYLIRGPFGVVLHNDVGRVWVEGEQSRKWHDGYGIGLWVAPYDLAALTLNYNMSEDEKLVTFTFSYLF